MAARTSNFYAPKAFLSDIIHTVANEETQDGGADMVIITGKFGERGVAFYPYDAQGDPEAKVGFSLLGRGINDSHTNLCREQAVALVELLVAEYGMSVTTEEVVHTMVTVS